MSEAFELLAKLGVVIDFPVEDDNGVAVLADHGLVAGLQVDNLQPGSAQGEAADS